MTGALALLNDRPGGLSIVHQAGEEEWQSVANAYADMKRKAEIRPFLHDMGARYDWADVVVSRSGAGAVSEIAANGRAAVLIPYPYAAGGHQRMNAMWLVRKGGALLIEEREEDAAERLAETLCSFRDDRTLLREMALRSRQAGRQDAAGRVVDVCVELLNEKGE
jgi:UDP-N-acetylglucosamine--N-acetylmuramyl-(pentapeptide) pyrophosphoryl-undecaprenol N-acetylglucosamine transferase